MEKRHETLSARADTNLAVLAGNRRILELKTLKHLEEETIANLSSEEGWGWGWGAEASRKGLVGKAV